MNRRSAAFLSALTTLFLLITLGCTGAGPAAAPVRPDAATDTSTASSDSDRQRLAGRGDGSETGGDQQTVDGALIVHTGTLDLEVVDLRAAVDQATGLIGGLGGNVAESHEQNTDGEQSATVTYRVPAARWTEAVAGLRALGRLVAEDTGAQDVTAQVVDLDARIANLRASEAALQEIMIRAGTIADVLKVQAELTTVRGDIESMTAQRDHLADRAALGTLEVRFNVPIVAADVASQGWDPGREVDQAVAFLVRVGQGLASIGIWLAIVVLPVIGSFAVLAYVAYRLRRRYAARQAAPDPAGGSV